MRNKIGIACMVTGVVLVLAALSLFFWNWRQNQKAEQSAKHILSKMMEQLENDRKKSNDLSGSAAYPDPYASEMTEVWIDGYAYIGYLTIPALNLELPVMSEWDYSRLKLSPCRYSGSTKTDDFVIAAHNYSKHFGKLSDLSEEDRIYFTDMDGIEHSYVVQTIEVLSAASVEEMSSGEYALTLFTCTYGGKSRIAVRCVRATDKPR